MPTHNRDAASPHGRLLERASALPWYVVEPPWNEGAPWINAESPDPHGGHFVCDLTWPHDMPEDVDRSEANAELIVQAVNEYDTLRWLEAEWRKLSLDPNDEQDEEIAKRLQWLDDFRSAES